MEIIAKISKGTKMDQIYISKARAGLDAGSYVIISPLKQETILSNKKIIPHIITISQITLIEGLSTDPLYNLMLSKCISKERLIFKTKRKFDYKILDIHLLKSESLIFNFDILNGNQKYYLTRNLISLILFIKNKKITPHSVEKEIEKSLNIGIKDLKDNLIKKKAFIGRYTEIYNKTKKEILNLVKNDTK